MQINTLMLLYINIYIFYKYMVLRYIRGAKPQGDWIFSVP